MNIVSTNLLNDFNDSLRVSNLSASFFMIRYSYNISVINFIMTSFLNSIDKIFVKKSLFDCSLSVFQTSLHRSSLLSRYLSVLLIIRS